MINIHVTSVNVVTAFSLLFLSVSFLLSCFVCFFHQFLRVSPRFSARLFSPVFSPSASVEGSDTTNETETVENRRLLTEPTPRHSHSGRSSIPLQSDPTRDFILFFQSFQFAIRIQIPSSFHSFKPLSDDWSLAEVISSQ